MHPASSSSFTAAKPTEGRNRSTRQVTNSATRRGGELDTSSEWHQPRLGTSTMAWPDPTMRPAPAGAGRAAAEEHVAARRALDGGSRILGDHQVAIDLERAGLAGHRPLGVDP